MKTYSEVFAENEYSLIHRVFGSEAKFDQTKLDKLFGAQRLSGANPTVIERVRSANKVQQRYVL